MKVPLAAILRALRAHKGLTQESIPEGSNRQYLSQLEHGKSSPTLDKLQDLSEAYGASPLLLVGAATSIQEGISVEALIGKFADRCASWMPSAHSRQRGRSWMTMGYAARPRPGD
ncbi:helix-turn-helix domain-containing protein [Pseudomonas syringae pv. aptata]|uniref:helix-turn-helix domain-containing protein n=1 Tax=Pseudomonas syringae TaxID=317 RepID=UPI001FFD85FC|nr:helix-turn-helix transcriptional regulator [Pseudomonas syringae]MCK0547714.1 helix-turn-helix domain-containing protein [Pseudomonas syringae pv. aptata]